MKDETKEALWEKYGAQWAALIGKAFQLGGVKREKGETPKKAMASSSSTPSRARSPRAWRSCR